MTAPRWPESDLVELHQLFLKVLASNTASEKRPLVAKIVVHPGCRVRLTTACLRGRRRRKAYRFDAQEDEEVLDEAVVRLTERLLTGRLTCADRGPQKFACWFWKLCCCVAADAWKKYRRSGPFRVPSVPLDDLKRATAPAATGWRENQLTPWEELLQLIEMVPDLQLQGILYDCAAGLTLKESASGRQISERTVVRLRKDGVLVLRELRAAHNRDDS